MTAKSKTKCYPPTLKEAREYDKRNNYIEITPAFVFVEGGGCEASFTHRVFKKIVADYQKWEKTCKVGRNAS